jgi:outer membrane immunogenic protein
MKLTSNIFYKKRIIQMANRALVALTLTVSMFTGGLAHAADLIIPVTPQPIMPAAGFDWDGLYVGAQGGAQFGGATNGVVGGFAGVNFNTGAGFVAGVEMNGDYVWNGAFNAWEVLASGRVGALVTDDVLFYGKAGLGYRDTNNNGPAQGATYAFGGGLEFAAADSVTIRGEVLGQGFLGAGAPNGGAPVAVKTTIGAAYHF